MLLGKQRIYVFKRGEFFKSNIHVLCINGNSAEELMHGEKTFYWGCICYITHNKCAPVLNSTLSLHRMLCDSSSYTSKVTIH